MIDLKPATFEEFERECEHGNVIAVVRTVLADLQTPLGAFVNLSAPGRPAFLLESIEGGERVARYSFIGANPSMLLRARGSQTVVEREGRRDIVHENAIEFLRRHFAARKLARRSGLAPLAGGMVGYLAYDAARWFEPALNLDGQRSGGDDAVFMFFRTVVAFDRVRQQMEIVSLVCTDEVEGDRARLEQLYNAAVSETARIANDLQSQAPKITEDSSSTGPAEFQAQWPREQFEAAVTMVREYIAAGDCYQAVISQQFAKQTSASPLAIYRALRATNPSPYMYFLKLDNEAIIGASPEMLVRCRDREVEYRPIAGTRPRGQTEMEDAALAEEMRRDEKEVAEHTMLVDLGRNDLGRVSDYGTVRVESLMTVEKYSHVQHLVSGLRSRLREDCDRFDALAACFPAGTVTGAPKIRAMQIIDELEPSPRGVYAGAVLYADYDNNLDSCIAIRTIHLRDGVATIQAGAGIVADSIPANEFEECTNKARAMVRSIELAEKGL